MLDIDAPEQIDRLVAEAEALTPDRRDLLSLLFGFFGAFSLVGGHVYIRPLGPVGLAATLLLFDPVGVLGLVTAAFVARPRGRLAALLRKVLGHSKYGLGLAALIGTVGLVEGLAWFVWELLR